MTRLFKLVTAVGFGMLGYVAGAAPGIMSGDPVYALAGGAAGATIGGYGGDKLASHLENNTGPGWPERRRGF